VASGRDERDATEWIEHKQIIVAGDDEISVAVHGEVKNFVILWIPARVDDLRNRYNLDYAAQVPEEFLPIFDAHLGVESRARQYVGEFSERDFGDE
jgi:hypothetical protein